MTILPKKKPPPPDGDPANKPPPPAPRPAAPSTPPQWGGGVGVGSGGTGVGSAGVGGAIGVGGCCSGPGRSKRWRQAPGVGAIGGDSPEPEEVGAGYNSEDEYEGAAAHIEAMDPATVEQQEHWFEKALLGKKGFIIKQIKEDGACLFRAVGDQEYGDQDIHEVVRKHCMGYLMKNADCFSNCVTEDFTTYINRKRKNNCHRNHIEMQAMAEMYNYPVEAYQYSTGTSVVEPINTYHGIHQNEDEPIRVSYHRNIHYNSVVNLNKATIEESWIEQRMLEDKKRASDWEATNEAIEEQVARESYLQWLRDQKKQAHQVHGPSQPWKASTTCSSATAAASSGLKEWTSRSPRKRNSASSQEHPELHAELDIKSPSPGTVSSLAKPPSPCAPGTSSQFSAGADQATSPLVSLYPALECRALIQQMSPSAFGLNDWDDDESLASVLAVSQQEYLDSMKKKCTETLPQTRVDGNPSPGHHPQYPFLPSSATPPSLAFLPSCLLPLFPFPSPCPTVFWLAHHCTSPIAAAATLHQLMCPVAPHTAASLHSTGDSGKGAKGQSLRCFWRESSDAPVYLLLGVCQTPD
ncbi:OTU domain-containing protein 5 [Heterocephalus glaber]|uniref:OTU domain-containing protein 5 n=1 Tax=Heterocephalus glaber TaxID=10181 RepID=G5BNR4_HETGA|nr:OTU domain-containing protein 5 [Heterocephalus glaber]